MAFDKEGAKKVVDQAGHAIDDGVDAGAKATGIPKWLIWVGLAFAAFGFAKWQGWV